MNKKKISKLKKAKELVGTQQDNSIPSSSSVNEGIVSNPQIVKKNNNLSKKVVSVIAFLVGFFLVSFFIFARFFYSWNLYN
ncbi:MAG: hypothetical protein ACP5MZ_02815 [Candidatus Micrarchaeia archaeon]